MKKLILSSVLLGLASFAGAVDQTGNIEEQKKFFIQHIDERMEGLTTARKCAEAAQTPDALRDCRQALHEKNKADSAERREKMKEKRRERKAERGEERKEERKEKKKNSES
jgi:GTP cyclohydrolase III